MATNFDINKEWNFIKYEVHNRKPEGFNYQGIDLFVRKFLILLQVLLSKYETSEKLEKEKIEIEYIIIKNAYLRLIN